MKLSTDTHTQVSFWILNEDIQKFDSIAKKQRLTRSDLLRATIVETNKKFME